MKRAKYWPAFAVIAALLALAPPRRAGAQEMLREPAPATAATTTRIEMASPALKRMLRAAANLYGLDPALMTAIARVESDDDPAAVSPRGAIGVMQLMPQTAARFGVTNPADPVENLLGAARFLSYLRQASGPPRTLPNVLAAYNAGEGAVARYGGIPPYAETRSYVRKVLLAYLSQPAVQPDRHSARRSSPRLYSTGDGPAEEPGDPFRQLELIQRNRALAAKSGQSSHVTKGTGPALKGK